MVHPTVVHPMVVHVTVVHAVVGERCNLIWIFSLLCSFALEKFLLTTVRIQPELGDELWTLFCACKFWRHIEKCTLHIQFIHTKIEKCQLTLGLSTTPLRKLGR